MRALLTLLLVAALLAAVAVVRRGPSSPPAALPIQEGPAPAALVNADSARSARAAVRRRIADADTYLGHALAERDSVLTRWRERSSHPLMVHLAAPPALGHSRGELQAAVRDAFDRWERTGAIPVRFVFVTDSASADVHVRWVGSFLARKTGQADVVWDGGGWLTAGALTLAVLDDSGSLLPPEGVRTTALHEIGHLLGLPHSDDPNDVMYPITRIRDLTTRDRRSAGLLYALPPGPVKDP